MDFKLNFNVPPFPGKLNYEDKILLIGSCFAENIGDKLRYYKFNCVQNPHGILYNPLNAISSLNDCISNRRYTEADLFFANDCWNSFNHHSRFSNTNKEKCLEEINSSILEGHQCLKEAKWLIVTFGSAFIYKKNGAQVANCHKIPQKEFTKEIISVEEIINSFTAIISQLTVLNSQLKILFTVSPVRYIRDGLVENNLSKAILLQSVHELVKQHSNCHYFPAYEIVNDELRDYRFFKEDLVHPNEMAVNYVWEKFTEAAFDEKTKDLYEKISEILIAKEHRPFNPEGELHEAFRKSYLNKVKKLKEKYPYLSVEDELNFFNQ
jgi:hypothetical protein